MVEARVRKLPGYLPMPEYDDGASDGGAFLWRLGDAFDLWDNQGDALEEDEIGRSASLGCSLLAAQRYGTLTSCSQLSKDLARMKPIEEALHSSFEPPAACAIHMADSCDGGPPV